MIKKALITALLFFFFNNLSFAVGNVLPFPKGKVYVTNGYGGSGTHQGDYYYSLDFRAYDTANRCDSYGAPVLAAKSGMVIKEVNPIQDKLGAGYGVHVYIKHDDNSVLRYAHMIDGSLAVKKGDSVRQGQILGLMGATGNTSGAECQAFDGTNNGAHLHFEMRDKKNKAKNPEPLVGQENYTDMSISGSPYISTTLMHDPNNHWAKYKGRVPYRLTYSPSAVHSFSPLIVQKGTNQVFTIKGENLFDDLSVTLPGCRNMQWYKRDSYEQQFSCDLPKIKGIKSGFIKFSSGGKPDFHFAVELVADKEEIEPIITKAEAVSPLADKNTDFIIEGKHIPADLEFNLKTCKNFSYSKITPSYREFSCRLPHTIKEANGKRVNGSYTFNTGFSSESADFSYPMQFSADYEVRIDGMEPFIAASGMKTSFTFTGKNLNLAKVIWIEKCDNLREIERSDDKITIECVPQSPNKLWYYFVPDFLRKDLYKIILKDEPGGSTLFESKILIIPINEIKQNDDAVKEMPKDLGGNLNEEANNIDQADYQRTYYSNYATIKEECLNYPHPYPYTSATIIQRENGITIKNDLVDVVKEGFVRAKGAIAFFIKKTDIELIKDIESEYEKIPNESNFYSFLIKKLNIDEVGISVSGYDITINISDKKIKEKLKGGYCFIYSIENDIPKKPTVDDDNSVLDIMSGVDTFYNSLKK